MFPDLEDYLKFGNKQDILNDQSKLSKQESLNEGN